MLIFVCFWVHSFGLRVINLFKQIGWKACSERERRFGTLKNCKNPSFPLLHSSSPQDQRLRLIFRAHPLFQIICRCLNHFCNISHPNLSLNQPFQISQFFLQHKNHPNWCVRWRNRSKTVTAHHPKHKSSIFAGWNDFHTDSSKFKFLPQHIPLIQT